MAAAAALETLGAPSTAPIPIASSAIEGPAQVLSNAHGRRFYQELQAKQLTEVERARKQLDAVFALDRARKGLQQPVVPLQTERIRRDAESLRSNLYGCIVGSAQHRVAVSRARDKNKALAKKKQATVATFWDKHRPAAVKAETALAELGDIDKLGVGHLKAIVLSRTGHLAKAKNNLDGALLAEARAAATAQPSTLLPEPAVPAADALGDSEGGEGEDDPVSSCASCLAEFADSALPAPDENGHLWCECGGRISLST